MRPLGEQSKKVLWREIFVHKSLHSDACILKDMFEASERHKQNVEELEATLKFLEQNESDAGDNDELKPPINFEFMDFIKKWKNSCNKPVDYDMVSFCFNV